MPRAALLVVTLALVSSAVAAQQPKLPLLPPPGQPDAANKSDAGKPDSTRAAKPEAKKPDPAQAELFEKLLRDEVVKKIPDPLLKSSQNWGKQVAVTVVHRHREGLRVWTQPVQELVNDGTWRRIEVRIPDPKKTSVSIDELTQDGNGKTFTTVTFKAERVDVHLQHQVWRNGRLLYGGESHVHCTAGVTLKSVIETKAEPRTGVAPAAFALPDLTLKVTVTDADLFFDNIEVDEVASRDGPLAKALAEFVIRKLRESKPDLERELLEKANAAIVKSAGTREVKVSLEKILMGKSKK